MKHKVTLLLSIIVIVALGIVSIQTYNRHKAYEKQVYAEALALQVQQATATKEKQTIFQQGLAQLENQCSTDKLTYESLTPAEQAKTKAPDCEVNLVE